MLKCRLRPAVCHVRATGDLISKERHIFQMLIPQIWEVSCEMTSGRIISTKTSPAYSQETVQIPPYLAKRVFVDMTEGLDLGRLSSITMALMIESPVRTEDAVITEAETEMMGE